VVVASHRIGVAAEGRYLANLGDGSENRSFGAGASLSYAYRLSRPVEVGVQATYLRVRDADPDLFLPAFTMRLSTPAVSRERLELGGTLRLGAALQTFHDSDGTGHSRQAVGGTFSLAPDVTYRLSDRWALRGALDVSLGVPLHAATQDDWEAPWLTFVSTGLSIGVVTSL